MPFRGLEVIALIEGTWSSHGALWGDNIYFSEWLGEGLTYQTLISTTLYEYGGYQL